mgnify:CR=1 FL=1
MSELGPRPVRHEITANPTRAEPPIRGTAATRLACARSRDAGFTRISAAAVEESTALPPRALATELTLERALELLRPWFEDASKKKLGQHSKYDQHVLANHGVTVRGIAHDTLLESYVLESHMRHDMESLAKQHLGLATISYDDVTGTGAKRIPFSEPRCHADQAGDSEEIGHA